MRSILRRVAAAIPVLSCAAVAAQGVQPWTTYQGNAAHTGYVPVTLNVSEFTKAWSTVVGGGAALQPLTAADGMVYVSQTGYFSGQGVYVLKAQDGSTLWHLSFPDIYSVNPPAYDNGNVYLQTVNNGGDSWVRGYDASTGAQLFQSLQGAQWERYLAPTIVDHTLYVDGGTYGGMYSFDGTDGHQNWFADLSQYDMWTPAVDATYAYAYVGETGLNVIKRADGQLAYRIADNNFSWNGYSMNQAPVLGYQGDVLAINGGRLISFDLAKRKIRWTQQDEFRSQPSVTNGVIYAVNGGALSARREDNGAELWSWRPTSDTLDGPLVVTDSHVFVAGQSSTYAVDLNAHTSTWSYPQAGWLALSEGMLYIAGSGGALTAVAVGDLQSGGANLKLSLKEEWVDNAGLGYFALRATVANKGPSNATRVLLKINVPRSFGVSHLDRACRLAQRTITCHYDGIPVGEVASAKFNLVPTTAGVYSVSAKVSATQADPVLRNNQAVSQLVVP